VQLQDKLIEDRDAAHAESQQREELREHQDKLPGPEAEAVRDATLERRAQLLGVIRMILDRQNLEIGGLRMPPREARALEALQAAVEGRSTHLNEFLYASDRRDLLEGALAALQPDLTHADDLSARELQAQFADLTGRVAELREALGDLEDAQDELLEDPQKKALEAIQGPPKPKPVPSDPDAPRPATTLTGPDLPEPAPPATTLTGPEPPAPPRPATTLTGPDLPVPPRLATTLIGPDLPEPRDAPRPMTTLTGPDLPEPPPAPSTLGSDDGSPATLASADHGAAASAARPAGADQESAATAKRPWWRKPFG
jgi:hypothetical protein